MYKINKGQNLDMNPGQKILGLYCFKEFKEPGFRMTFYF